MSNRRVGVIGQLTRFAHPTPRQLVFLDESGANLAMGRSHAWLPRGKVVMQILTDPPPHPFPQPPEPRQPQIPHIQPRMVYVYENQRWEYKVIVQRAISEEELLCGDSEAKSGGRMSTRDAQSCCCRDVQTKFGQ